jgi:sterol desaturase/sphingolipid hydroxylase (fatty acid hydroxylase superfamily)
MMFDVIVTAATSLAWLVVMFVPLERAFPARARQRFFRDGFATDLLFFFGQHLAFAALAVAVLTTVSQPIRDLGLLSGLRSTFGAWPIALQIAAILMLGDFVAYWGHRLQHNVDILWRFHAVHHSNTEVDWLAAHREHPLDGMYTQLLVNLPAIVLGFQLNAVLGVVAFRSLWAIFIHSNVRLPLGPLAYMVGSPTLHRWHHARLRDAGNYANLAPWLDLLFGTFHLPDGDPDEMGVDEPLPLDYIGLLVDPLRPRRDDADAGTSELV